MDISKETFFLEAAKADITLNQAETLWLSLQKNAENANPAISKWLFYLGAGIIFSAMAWLMNTSLTFLGGGGIFAISFLYAIFFFYIGSKFWPKPNLKIPAGLFITLAVCMIPLMIYGLESYFKIWPLEYYPDHFQLIKANRIFIEITTILMGLLALNFFPFPFLTAPIFLSAWLLTVDFISLIRNPKMGGLQTEWVSLIFGISLILISYIIHLKKNRDYAFWGYLIGLTAFWISLGEITWLNSEGIFFIFLIVNIGLMLVSILLKSRVFMFFGVFGTYFYFGHLVYRVFENSIAFPFLSTISGLITIYLGILYQKNIQWIENTIRGKAPLSIRHLLPNDNE